MEQPLQETLDPAMHNSRHAVHIKDTDILSWL